MINRVQAGVPSGGQFATTTHTESGISLDSAHTPIYALPADETIFYRSRGEYEPTERVSVGELLKPSRNGWDTRFEETAGHIIASKDESIFTFQPLPGEEPKPVAYVPVNADDDDDDDLDRCSECGEDNTGGDGYDGLCGNCADILYGDDEEYDDDSED